MKDDERQIDPVLAAIARDARILRTILFAALVILLLLICRNVHAFQVCWEPPTENVDGTVLDDLAGYTVYFGRAQRSYTETRNLSHDPDAIRYCYNVRTSPGDYYVAMTAWDSDGNESAYSNEVRKREERLEGPGGGRLLGPSGGTVITRNPDGSTTTTFTEER